MKFARVFLKPDASTWVDFGVVDHATMPLLWMQMHKEGFIVGDVGVVPLASIHHVLLLETGQTTTTLTVLPGGKLN